MQGRTYLQLIKKTRSCMFYMQYFLPISLYDRPLTDPANLTNHSNNAEQGSLSSLPSFSKRTYGRRSHHGPTWSHGCLFSIGIAFLKGKSRTGLT